MSSTWLIVGLGNPGPDYQGTRHNIGQLVVDELADRSGASFKAHKSRAQIAQTRLGVLPGGAPGPRAVLAKPATYMNLSGGPVAGLAQFFSLSPETIVVVHDDMDLPFDTVKAKRGGGEGGHNGLKDISKALGDKEFLRIRVGIGRPPGRMDPASYVLKPFSASERRELPLLVSDAADAVEMLIAEGLEATQQRFHSKSV